MKRLLALLLSILLIVQMVPAVFAQSNAEVSLSSTSAACGENVTITVSIQNCVDVKSIYIVGQYDEEILEIVSGTWLVRGMLTEDWTEKYGDAAITFSDNTNVNTDIFEFVFRIKENAQIGKVANVSCEIVIKTMEGKEEIPVDVVTITEGNVTVLAKQCAHTDKTEVPSKSPDCLNVGNNLYYTCDACGQAFKADGTETTVEAESIPALGHDLSGATCTEAAKCQREGCDYTEGETLGHSFTNYVSNNDATCIIDGTKTAKCDRCDKTDIVTDAGSAKGHDYADATCTTPKTCKVCGAVEGSALGHSFTNYMSNNDATCTADGTKTAKCDRCDATDTIADAGSAKGHSYAVTWSKGEDGHWHECSACGDKADFAAHEYGTEGDQCVVCGYERTHVHRLTLVPAKDAACITDGNKAYYTCSGCENWFEDGFGVIVISDKTSVIISALGHDLSGATCTEAAKCRREGCDYSEGEALGHSFTNYVSNNDATCTADGTKTAKCDRCDETDTVSDSGSAKGHNYAVTWSKGEDGHWHECSACGEKAEFASHDYGTEGDQCVICGYERTHVHRLILVPAAEVTCTTDGNKAYYTCSGCEAWFEDSTGNVKIDNHDNVIIKALGHDDIAVVTAPTCTEKGYTTHTCSRCHDSYVDTYVDALGHDYAAVVTAPTCTEKGYTTHTCSRCHDSYVDTYVDALGHDHSAVVTAPTCTEKGYTTHTCSRCNDSYIDAYVDALGHDYETEWSQGDVSGHWHACKNCDGHDTPAAHIPGPAATEDDPQLCTVCGYVIQPALGHTHRAVKVDGHAATCTEAGQKTYYVCEGCGKWFEDATANVEITDHDSIILAPSHNWLEATCTEPKTCQVCGATEGEANGHTPSDWNTDETSHWKVCTVCNERITGSKAEHTDENEDGKCDACGYAQAKCYAIIEGMDGKWTVNSSDTLTFRADGEFRLFTGVEVDDMTVDPSNYTAVSGSTIVTLRTEYLKTLATGKHKLTVTFRNGSASANFDIQAAPKKPASNGSPKTGDDSHFMVWTVLLLASAVGIVALIIGSKKKWHDGKHVR